MPPAQSSPDPSTSQPLPVNNPNPPQTSSQTSSNSSSQGPAPVTVDNNSSTSPISVPSANSYTSDPFLLNSSVPNPSDLINSAYAPTQAQQEEGGLLGNVAQETGAAKSLATYQYNSENAAGIPAQRQTIADLTAKSSGLNDQLDYLNNYAPTTISDIEQNGATGRGITTGGLQAQNSADLRNNQIKAASIAAQSLTVKSALYAAQGNMSVAETTADQAAQVQYDAQQQDLAYQQSLLAAIQPQLTRDQATQAASAQAELQDRQDQITILQANRSAVLSVMTSAAQNGASASVIQSIQNASSPGDAYAIAQAAGVPMAAPGRYKDTLTPITNLDGSQSVVKSVFDTVTGKFVSGNDVQGSGTVAGSSSSPTQSTVTASQLNSQTGATIANPTGTGTTANPVPAGTAPQPGEVSPTTGVVNKNGVSFSEYGTLAKTDFNPQNQIDQAALTYINSYLQNGSVPSARQFGSGTKPGYMTEVTNRATQLYYQATGSSLQGVSPTIMAANQTLITGNNAILNSLGMQNGTVSKNFALALSNMKAGNINEAIQPINDAVDQAQELLGDPSMQQYFVQNTTLANELGNLVAVKNAGGTTVHDKQTGEELLPANATQAQQTQELATLIQEAQNNASSISEQNSSLYKQIDPLMLSPNNPNRAQTMNSDYVSAQLNKQNLNYNDIVSKVPAGQIAVIDQKTGQVGYIPSEEFDASQYIRL